MVEPYLAPEVFVVACALCQDVCGIRLDGRRVSFDVLGVVLDGVIHGRLQPRYIETGQRNEDYIEVTSGLEAGETVVTSGNFLIDAETRLKTGIKQW